MLNSTVSVVYFTGITHLFTPGANFSESPSPITPSTFDLDLSLYYPMTDFRTPGCETIPADIQFELGDSRVIPIVDGDVFLFDFTTLE